MTLDVDMVEIKEQKKWELTSDEGDLSAHSIPLITNLNKFEDVFY
jgi:hypothetical protein